MKNRRSIHTIVRIYDVSSSTLAQHSTGGRSAAAYHATRQKLSPAEEDILTKMACELADQGFPAMHQRITEMATEILRSRVDPADVIIGVRWIDIFLPRHHDMLQTHWSKL
ncbi:hypothetical protein M422DRAFT_164001 [Sphaerobolus stellatus SS14]|nr:hypothetical protein M422DRAFT_164001 [Sphaerobolus stellatus SS14]